MLTATLTNEATSDSTINITSDNSFLLSGLQNQVDSTYCNSATVKASLYEYTDRLYLSKASIADETSKLGIYCNSHGLAEDEYFYLMGTEYDGEYQVHADSTDDYIITQSGTYSASKRNAMTGNETIHRAVVNGRNITLSYVTDSDGNYRGTIPDTALLRDQYEYYLIVTATDASSNVLTIRQKYEANFKD